MTIKMNKDVQLVSNFTVKGLTEGDEDIIIEGFANTTSKDRMGDVIVESAWTQGGLDNYLKNPILLAYHDYKHPVGIMVDYGVNNKGLHITGKISKAAGDVYDLVKSGILKAFSVGFMVKDADYDQETDIFVIKDLELHEISVVSIPANADSLFSLKKSFENDKEYNEFKDSLIQVEQSTDTEGDTNVDKNEENKISLTAEELAAKMQKAIDDALAKATADAEAKAAATAETKSVAVEAGRSGAEKLMAEVEKRLADKNVEIEAVLAGLQADLKDKSAELLAMQNSKMSFVDKGDSRKLTDTEIDTAYLVAKLLNKKVEETNYYKSHIIQKVGEHLASATAYENIYSTRMYDKIQEKLVMEPLFNNKIQMTSRSMTFPFNPRAGYASWVAEGAYKSLLDPADHATVAAGSAGSTNGSTGAARAHLISTIDLKAEKLASKEAIGYEEEEDSIIPILPIVIGAIAKRMARTTDIELLRGATGTATVTDIGLSLINGVATLANTGGETFTQAGAFGTSNPITVADLQSTRRKMGAYGLNPSEVTYVVCESAYWDLLEDPDFRTMDLVGANATILRGQVGAVNGSPVVVSDSFATPAIGTYAAIALNTSNYLFGELRGVNTERDKDILNQKNWVVTTRRFAFNEVDATAGSCAVLKYPAA